MSRNVFCVKNHVETEGLGFIPWPGALGKKVFENIGKEAWQSWLAHQTMLINENRLSLADARARQYIGQQMENYFFGEGADQVSGYTPPQS